MNATEILRIATTSYWVPPDSERVVREGYAVVRYANGFEYDTGVYEIDSPRSPAEILADVTELARTWHRSATYWNGLTEHTRPAELVELLLAHGGEELERLAILALDLTGRESIDIPAGVTVEVPRERRAAEASSAVAAEAFGRPVMPVTDEEIERNRQFVRSGVAFLGSAPQRPSCAVPDSDRMARSSCFECRLHRHVD